jgi:hypothetical protein
LGGIDLGFYRGKKVLLKSSVLADLGQFWVGFG